MSDDARWARALTAGLLICLAMAGCSSGQSHGQSEAPNQQDAVAPVRGPSLLKALNVSLDNTMLGKQGGDGTAPASAREEPMPPVAATGTRGMWSWVFGRTAPSTNARPFVIAGADIYRMSCQACHGPRGAGAPPEINSIVGPVQGTSLQLLTERLQKAGRPVDPEFDAGIVAGAASDLTARIHDGGQKMPAFAYLGPADVDALIAFLKQMVGVPEAPAVDPRVTLPAAAIGELIVKGTCHTCHDATGPGRYAMMQALTPPLASMPDQDGLAGVVAKVRWGRAPGMMMMVPGRSRMPRFPYFTDEELAAVLLYLRQYPPQG